MNVWVAFRLFTLSFLLFVVVYFMYYMRTDGLDRMRQVFSGSEDVQRVQDIAESRLNWCETKVKSIQYRDQFTVVEDQFQWILLPSRKKLDSALVGQWLGRNCTLRIERRPFIEIASTDMVTLWQVQFANGDSGTLFYSPIHKIYGWKGLRFTSTQLPQAQAELSNLTRP